MSQEYPCPACGFLVFDEPSGSFDICRLCNWQDDPVQLRSPGYAGGANAPSLCEYQARVALLKAPLNVDVSDGFRRDRTWRPLRSVECRVEELSQADGLYYWRASSPAVNGFHRARITWSGKQSGKGLPDFSSTIDPSWLDGAKPVIDEGWSLVCEFDRPPSV